MKKRGLSLRAKQNIGGYLFLLPWITGVCMFTAFPFFYSLFLSFQKVSIPPGGIQTSFIGLSWYKEAFTVDTAFVPSLLDTSRFVAIATPMIVIFSLIISLLLNSKFHGRTFFRAVFFFPVIIISGPVIAQMLETKAAQIITPEKYAVYNFVASLPQPVSLPLVYVFDNIVLILWFSGVQMLIYLAYLQKIGSSIHEAAAIDGASAWQFFWKITLPFLKPIILINAIYTIVELSGFANNSVNEQIEKNLILTGKVYGYSASLSWIYFVVILGILGVAFVLLKGKKGELFQ